ncbi:unnamed protein product [Closterium sp. NIES-64]|nr:unnamed protein product [Closterium sp. NIES-64]
MPLAKRLHLARFRESRRIWHGMAEAQRAADGIDGCGRTKHSFHKIRQAPVRNVAACKHPRHSRYSACRSASLRAGPWPSPLIHLAIARLSPPSADSPSTSLQRFHRYLLSVSPCPSPYPTSPPSHPHCSLQRAQARAAVSTDSEQAASAGTPVRPLRVIISGAPASGKGTQCELIVAKYGLTHISAGDLLRAEVAAGTEGGRQAKAHMDAGRLVPDDVVVTIVKNRLAQEDAQSRGWLLDGYPRSLSQAHALLALDISPDVFILLDVPQEILVERVVGRRLDPATNRIYHLSFSPPESEEIAARLTQRSDDTEEKVGVGVGVGVGEGRDDDTGEKVKARLETHNANVASVLDVYAGKLVQVNGHRGKEEVFGDIDSILTRLQQGQLSFD